MEGRRRYLPPEQYHLLTAGDYMRGEHWWARTPNGHLASLGEHEVVEHVDGTITVSPSIKVSSSRQNSDGKMETFQVYHGFLEHGTWREC